MTWGDANVQQVLCHLLMLYKFTLSLNMASFVFVLGGLIGWDFYVVVFWLLFLFLVEVLLFFGGFTLKIVKDGAACVKLKHRGDLSSACGEPLSKSSHAFGFCQMPV